MAKDDRIWGKFAVDMPDNPKILPLSDAAFRCLIEATLYSRRMQSDGFLASRLAVAKWSLAVLQELCTNDPAKPSLIEVDGGYLIHDYAEFQEMRAEIEARRERNRAAGSRGGIARAKQVAKQVAKQSVKRNPSEPQAEKEEEKDISLSKERETPQPPKGGKGSRLDSDWMPSNELVAQMRDECPLVDLKSEHTIFVDYWIAQPGQKGIKTDWPATWRNWMRRKQTDHNGKRLTPTERAAQTAAAGRAVAGTQITSLEPKELE